MKTVSLALRNLTRNKRRNAILAVAIAFGFFVVTAIDGLTSGMVGNLENQITQLVGGNVVVQGLEWLPPETAGGKAKLVNIVRDRDYVKNIVDELGVKYEYYSCFTMSNGTAIFNGKKSMLQLYGRDLTEKHLQDSFQFVSGGVDLNVENGLIISDKIAESLNLQVGDEIIYSTYTVYGQNTFADMTITGILKSNSFLSSMQAYADIEDVNTITEMPEGGYSMFSIYLRDNDLFTISRQKKMALPCCTSAPILETAMELFRQHYRCHKPLRSVSLSAIYLVTANKHMQLSLFDDTAEQLLVQEQIEKTVDMLRYRFGHDAIMRASALLDPKLTGFNPKEDHTIHPYSYFR